MVVVGGGRCAADRLQLIDDWIIQNETYMSLMGSEAVFVLEMHFGEFQLDQLEPRLLQQEVPIAQIPMFRNHAIVLRRRTFFGRHRGVDFENNKH